MANESLQQAIDLIKDQAEKQEAGKLLKSLVYQEPNNELAWLWLSACINKKENKVRCLENVCVSIPKTKKQKQL